MCTINQDHMIHSSWDIKCKGQSVLPFWAIFALWPSYQPKKSKFWKKKKWKTHLEIWSFYNCVLQMRIIWCMVPEILSTTDIIFCHFRLFFTLLTPYNPENQNFEIMKTIPGGIIILNMSTINENHMMYDSWDMEHDRQDFFSFWTIFCPFTPPSPLWLTTQRIKIF